jgi:apolipoprotein N-acyltransferase
MSESKKSKRRFRPGEIVALSKLPCILDSVNKHLFTTVWFILVLTSSILLWINVAVGLYAHLATMGYMVSLCLWLIARITFALWKRRRSN